MNQLMRASLVGLLLLGAAFAARAQEGDAPPPAPVKVGKASKQSISTMMTATGTVVSRNDARIAAETPGRLTWVAEPGTQVERGGVLARVDDMKKVRGIIVYPRRIEEIVRGHKAVDEFQIVFRRVDGLDDILVRLDPAPGLAVDEATRMTGALVDVGLALLSGHARGDEEV